MHLPLILEEHLFNDYGSTVFFLNTLCANGGPNLVHVTHFFTCVGSSDLIHALTVVITIRNVLWPKVSGLYFRNWLFWPKFGPILAQQLGPILAQLGPILAHFVTGVGSSNLTVVITFRNVLWAKVLGFYFSKLAVWARFGPDLAKVWPRFGPNYVHMTHFVTGVGSSNLIYALTVAITFRNLLWVEVLGFYFIDWLFGPDLAQIWVVL